MTFAKILYNMSIHIQAVHDKSLSRVATRVTPRLIAQLPVMQFQWDFAQ